MDECFKVHQLDLVFGAKAKRAFLELDRGKIREDIQKEIQQIVAVHCADFSVRVGEILVIMGLSGSGKSSLLRCLNGMNGRGVGTARGEVIFRDLETNQETEIIRSKRHQLRSIRMKRISMVFQQFGLMPWQTVLENVAYPLEIQGVKRGERLKLALEKLKAVGLEAWKDRYPRELSGGMQQRVGLARAFVTNADVLLMDEPFSALDPLHRKHLQDEILQLQKAMRKTIVFVTHDFNEALRLGSRIAVMESGRILQIGSPRHLVDAPICEKVRQFTAEIRQPNWINDKKTDFLQGIELE